MRSWAGLTIATVVVAGAVTTAGLALGSPAGGDGGPATQKAPVETVLDIEYSRFTPSRLQVPEGTTVRFVLRNHDPIRHELIVGPPEVHARHEGGHEAVHPPVPGEVTVEPNGSAETTYRFDQPGMVVYACHLPGHEAYGMKGVVEVLPA